MDENIIGIIPSRMASTRFPGKPLAKILGKAMIYHVYQRSKMAKVLREVYIATCDEEIQNYCHKNHMNVVMTKNIHERASDRTAEAMERIEKKTRQKINIVVMIQGDEPLVVPQMIDLSVKPMSRDKNILVVNLMHRLKSKDEEDNPNIVKVVVDENSYALYFSRAPIPSGKKTKEIFIRYKQVPIIPFRRDFLITFNQLSSTHLESIESIDMLRVLGHGYKVKMVMSPVNSYSVDTPQDLERVKKLIRNNQFTSRNIKKRMKKF